jgi:2-polyprenyl-3-methyl-5-hydroxy-6-metoxy-1,4-benzoquinol methylase
MIMTPDPNKPAPGSPHPGWKDHWEGVYTRKNTTEVSWYQSHPEHSLALVETAGRGSAASIIDVGGGASTLVDHLLAAGYRNVTVLDIAHGAIEQAKVRLGEQASRVTWLEGDITGYSPTRQFDIWHDRAVFHFLTNEEDRSSYLAVLNQALKPEGQVIIATFAENGPAQCSGLNVVCYTPETLSHVLGPAYRLVETGTEDHHTPHGGVQQFLYCRFCRAGNVQS